MPFQRLFLIITIILYSFTLVKSNQPKATTENGIVVGTYKSSFSGFDYKAFEGIPYAKPPVNDNRFKVCDFFSDNNN